jgi:hypothetical protein
MNILENLTEYDEIHRINMSLLVKSSVKYGFWRLILHTLPYIYRFSIEEVRAQNNGRSTDNDWPKMPLDRSLFYLTGHFDRHICMPSNVIADVLN